MLCWTRPGAGRPGYLPPRRLAAGRRQRPTAAVIDTQRALLESDDPRAKFAVDLYTYRIGRELGSLAAAARGIDALVFTAGIGEHATAIRERVCSNLSWMGLELDEAANAAGGPLISTPGSRVEARVIPTDEELMIARHSLAVLRTATDGGAR